MMWQMFTAFGIMIGFVADLAFYKVHSDSVCSNAEVNL